MGNTESSVESSLSRSGSSARKRNGSQSPKVPLRRSGSCRRNCDREPGEPLRRSKTCRGKDRAARKAICLTTGLTLHQKALLTRKWNRMDRATIYEIGRLMFESVFKESPQFLAYIDLKNEPNWITHINFKLHVQQFVTALIECMRRLKEPSSACDILRDFGATYAKHTKRVSPQFFEKIANALNRAAAELQEGDHLSVEKNECRQTPTTEWEKTSIITDSTNTLSTTASSIPTVRSSASLDRPKHRLVSRHSDTQMELGRKITENTVTKWSNDQCCASHDNKSLCPITAEAWIVLSAFLANQIKLGYELERMIKSEMSKLGLDNNIRLGQFEAGSKRPVHA